MEDKNLIHSIKKYPSKNAWQRVTLARLKERPTALDYIKIIFDDFIELHGDRSFSDDQSIVCGIGLLNNKSVTIVAQQKGKNTKDNIKRNFAMPKPEGYRKALRIMKQAEKFKRPIICFIDTPGAFCGINAEERGQGEAIARNLLEMSRLKTITLSIVIGEGGSGGALALAVADRVMMLENSIYSILSPEGFASILWKDASKAKEAAEVMKITAEDLKEFNVIDKIIKEPSGGAHKNLNKMAEILKENIINEIEILRKYPMDILLEKRYDKFRNMGVFSE
ncbi:acetyl-CoA carboxylase carboxyltransferase subunit alpha [Clostridium tepidum]|jgi:acetyl-CoA carboxylase carboxyl transferase subunit alpha|uniref:Acetyl-coenzyme A carboxylase carboxyl transferase subunit alpha n=1 Tax=Clostridium tepidum TaxID=1962263 RepID=A0A1S9IGK0_9CLOT|nr:acetyl-CoA carboxylase carboxyltransferase subunit alpha [Clostridium tepidum]MCR1934908.1 acetyl-CoA carboxylase carboxyltransferase subunit alpha [Clostridium tepidum]MDU6878737.1 acetyl-CoA carboxylase carboxyltransferase subunit alpha [Clostridium botulinum]OOO61841.1 acetyl-CoA carboxylase carboxyltransferase subunit alpha [Clostridium tepidum]OOO69461.1 acetyl-CoA carboxylase carboxyltransferase subunit alpha [Clostridium tepidum]